MSEVQTIDCAPQARVTRSLLGYGVVAGPLYVAVILVQTFIRPGFDLFRDDASLLSNGGLGWIQIANFVATGLCVVACGVGLARAMDSGRGSTWAPRLVAVYGIGLIAAGLFVADPMNGFPPGTAAGRPESISAHGILHIISAAVGFFAFIAACLLLARRFAGERRRAMAFFSGVTGVTFLAAFAGVASGSDSPVVVIAFEVALIIAWTWLAAVSLHFYREA